jgi:hypothetical protein
MIYRNGDSKLNQFFKEVIMASIEEMLNGATAQYFNALTSSLNLDRYKFQIISPSMPLGETSDSIWQFFNNIPPKSLINKFDLSGGNKFYDNYRGALSSLLVAGGNRIKFILGDDYEDWYNYLIGLNPLPTPQELPDICFRWTSIHVPDKATPSRNEYARQLNNPIGIAQYSVLDQNNFINGIPNFSRNLDDLRSAITQSSSSTITYDSSNYSSDVTDTRSGGSLSGFYKTFFASGDTNSSSLTEKILSNGINVDIKFDKVCIFSAAPGSWYLSSALNIAYNTKDNTVWAPGAKPDWEDFFGENGSMCRFLTSLIVVDGITQTITSHSSYSLDEIDNYNSAASGGVWPFFSAGGGRSFSHEVKINNKNELEITVSAPLGNPLIIGANVTDVNSFLGGGLFFVMDLIKSGAITV